MCIRDSPSGGLQLLQSLCVSCGRVYEHMVPPAPQFEECFAHLTNLCQLRLSQQLGGDMQEALAGPLQQMSDLTSFQLSLYHEGRQELMAAIGARGAGLLELTLHAEMYGESDFPRLGPLIPELARCRQLQHLELSSFSDDDEEALALVETVGLMPQLTVLSITGPYTAVCEYGPRCRLAEVASKLPGLKVFEIQAHENKYNDYLDDDQFRLLCPLLLKLTTMQTLSLPITIQQDMFAPDSEERVEHRLTSQLWELPMLQCIRHSG